MAKNYIPCYESSNHGNWLKIFVTNLKVVQGVERQLHCDNQSAVIFANQSLTKSKYIDIKYLVVKERVQNGQLSIEHIGTNSMVVDLLTKAVPAIVFCKHIAYMGLTSYDDM